MNPIRCRRSEIDIPEPERTKLRTAVEDTKWKVLAIFNHDLEQIFVSATDKPLSQIDRECGTLAAEIADWETARHRIDWIGTVGEFPTFRHAQMYAAWLQREGAFEGAEGYAMGLDVDVLGPTAMPRAEA